MGLANAIELVTDRASKAPDPDVAAALKNAMKRNGVLVGTTGAAENVLKIRPPLAFTERHIPVLVDALVTSLRELDLKQ
jgi:4-aminobutyrate aminotransferase-like enzyme